MNESDARCFTLIRALEEGDPEGGLLPLASRRAATREAAPPEHPAEVGGDPSNDGFLVRRARLLTTRLAGTHPEIARLAHPVSWRPWALALGSLLAFETGYLAAEFGPEQRLNLLSFPLVGLLLWNLFFYLLLGISAARRRYSRRRTPVPDQPVPGWFKLWRRVQSWRFTDSGATPASSAVAAFARAWTGHTAHLRTVEMRQALHGMAAALAAGLIAGLYVGGLALEYRAGWESTFLGAGTLESLLKIVFGPAAWLTGIDLPDAAHLSRIAWSSGTAGENAAPWIHLAAVTAGLFIIAPRLVLAGLAGRRAERLRNALTVYSLDGYSRPLLHAGQGGGERAVLVPLGHQPSERSLAIVRSLVSGLLGGSGRLELLAPVNYGEEQARLDALPAALSTPPAWLITLLNLAATPETEIHGDWLRGLRRLVERGTVARVLLLTDGAAFRAALNTSDADRRVAERLAAWRSLAASCDLEILLIGDEGVDSTGLAQAARRHAHPPALVA